MLNIIDRETTSKVLVSSRISGLIKGSTEVKLALMTTAESVDLLAHGAGLDAEAIPPSLVEVAKLCGRYLLSLSLSLLSLSLLRREQSPISSFCQVALDPPHRSTDHRRFWR